MALRTRTLDRIAAGISLALLTALGLFTFYLSQVAQLQNRSPVAAAPRANSPDYFVDRMAVLTMTPQGAPSYRLEARRLQHFPAEDIAEFEAPVMVSLDPARPRVTVNAARGQLLDRGDEVRLNDDVVLVREGSPGSPALQIRTSRAVVFPNEDRVTTDQAVEVVQGGRQLQGVGMTLDHRTRQLRVDSAVRAVIAAPEPPAAGSPDRSPIRP